ncbi:ABC transporter substrate-binding protein [Calidithermus chliarophilus]|uniref:ABC transporter substrate-binding protein n=1 Tax=Calidithermus chliarophilus TaxID=52023 RepID=UPI00040E5180|nr:ABC transporter substrate-binding protein [Calidithermus chliarophilus]
MNWKKAGLLTLTLAGLMGSSPFEFSQAQAQGQQITLQFWGHWLSEQRRPTITRIVNTWNAKNPNVKVEYTGVPFDQIINKTLASVAAGNPPDVVVIDIRTTRLRAAKGQNTNLSALGVESKKNLYFPNLWATGTYKGQQYGLPFNTDTRVLYYNKKAFREVGLDPTRPPKTWADLWNYALKLDKKEGNRYTRMGFHPLFGDFGYEGWVGNAKGLLFKDTDYDEPAINNPTAVKVLEWVKRWTDKYGTAQYAAFRASFGGGAQDEFMSGKVPMVVRNGNYIATIARNAPDLEYGIVPVPTEDGQQHPYSSWGGGFNVEIPKGTKHPKEALAFAIFLTTEGAKYWTAEQKDLPGYRLAQLENKDPLFLQLVNNMKYTFVAPTAAYAPTYGTAVEKAVQDVVLQGRDPKAALDEAQQTVMKMVEQGKRETQ